MNKILRWSTVALLFGAWPVLAGPGEGGASASGQAQSEAQATTSSATTQASAEAAAQAAVTGPDFDRLKENVKSKGGKVSAAARQRAEAKLESSARLVDQQAEKAQKGVEERMAAEFDLSADAMVAEKQALGVSWGQLMIAHTLSANAGTDVTVQQLFAMRKDNMGWGQIAAGLDLTLGEVVSAVHSESSVALGKAAADGKVAVIHGPGSRAGVGVGVGAGIGAQGKSASAGAGLDAGVKIKP